MVRYAFILMLICLVSAGVLALTYKITHPVYLEQMREEEKQALAEILPQACDFKEIKNRDTSYFLGLDEQGKIVGYIIRANATGYSSTIKMLVGIDDKGTILGLKILSQQETPGLGAKVTEIRSGEDEPWFTRQFKGRNYKQLSLETIDAITAATITSKAVVDGLKQEIEKFLVNVSELAR